MDLVGNGLGQTRYQLEAAEPRPENDNVISHDGKITERCRPLLERSGYATQTSRDPGRVCLVRPSSPHATGAGL